MLPYKPLERVTENLWVVKAKLGSIERTMSVVRMQNGDLVIHNAIALNDADMVAIEAWGKPAVLVVPNGFHRQDAWIYKQRYPKLTVIAPAGQRKKVEKCIAVDGSYADAPRDDTVEIFHIEGAKDNEGMIKVHSEGGTALIANDMITNASVLKFPMNLMIGRTGPEVPRFMRLFFIKDARACRSHLQALAQLPRLDRLVMMHGANFGADAPAQLQRAIELM